MRLTLFGKELGAPVAEIEVEKKEDVTLLDNRFELLEIKEIEAEDTILLMSE